MQQDEIILTVGCGLEFGLVRDGERYGPAIARRGGDGAIGIIAHGALNFAFDQVEEGD